MSETRDISEEATDEALRQVLRSMTDPSTAFILLPWSMPEALLIRIIDLVNREPSCVGIPVFIGEPSDAQALHTAAWLVLAGVVSIHSAKEKRLYSGAA